MLRRYALRLYTHLQVKTGPKEYRSAVLVTNSLPVWVPDAANIQPGSCDWTYTAKDYDRVLVYRPSSTFSVFESAYECVRMLKANNVQEADVHLDMNTGT